MSWVAHKLPESLSAQFVRVKGRMLIVSVMLLLICCVWLGLCLGDTRGSWPAQKELCSSRTRQGETSGGNLLCKPYSVMACLFSCDVGHPVQLDWEAPTLHRKSHSVFVQENLVCHGLLCESFEEVSSENSITRFRDREVGERQGGCGNHRAVVHKSQELPSRAHGSCIGSISVPLQQNELHSNKIRHELSRRNQYIPEVVLELFYVIARLAL